MMIRLIVIPMLLVLPMTGWSANDSLRCDRQLIRAGDPIWEVSRKCPEPFWREHYDRAHSFDRLGRPLELARYEIWTLNFGSNRLMRQLVFINGRLQHVISLDYGVSYAPGSRVCTPHELRKAGNTIAEIYARCGAPDHRYDLPTIGLYGFHSGPHQPQVQELWTYEFGPRHHPREVLFVDGRLHTISTQRR